MSDALDGALDTLGMVLDRLLTRPRDAEEQIALHEHIPVLLNRLYEARGSERHTVAARRVLAEGLAQLFAATEWHTPAPEVRAALVEFFVLTSKEADDCPPSLAQNFPLSVMREEKVIEEIRHILQSGAGSAIITYQLRCYSDQIGACWKRLIPESESVPEPTEGSGREEDSLW